jgi:phage terminase large subunit-like protein
MLEGTIDNDAWFAFVCHLDACAKCQKAGKHQPSDDCPDCDDWKTEGPHWLKANPNLGVTIQWHYLREQVKRSDRLPSQRNMVRRLNFCQWTQQATVWIPPEAWAACAARSLERVARRPRVLLGIDLSDKIDLSSVVAVFPREMDRETTIEVKGERVTVDRAIDVLAFFWMPKKSMSGGRRKTRSRTSSGRKRSYLTATTGAMVDHDAIVDFIIDVLAKKYQIKRIGIDQSGAAAVITRLRRHFGEEQFVDRDAAGVPPAEHADAHDRSAVVSGTSRTTATR